MDSQGPVPPRVVLPWQGLRLPRVFFSFKDLDILCLSCPWDQEELKRRVVAEDSSFYLIHPKKPGATYKVLWYRIYGSGSSTSGRCKVDLLLPGIMNIPNVPTSIIEYPEQGMPCAPFAVVFLLKLQAWADHLDSPEPRFWSKSFTDTWDLRRMLPIARAKGFNIGRLDARLPSSFVASAVLRVQRFLDKSPDTLIEWRALGFEFDVRAHTVRSIDLFDF